MSYGCLTGVSRVSYGRLTSYGALRLCGLPGQVAGRRDAGSPEPRTCPELSWRVQQGWGLEPQWLRRMTPGPSLPHAASASVVSLTPTPGAEGVQWPWEKFYHHSHQTESVWCGLVGKLFPGPCLHTSAPPGPAGRPAGCRETPVSSCQEKGIFKGVRESGDPAPRRPATWPGSPRSRSTP